MERRRWIKGIFAGGAVLALPRIGRSSALRVLTPDLGPWWLVEPLRAGDPIAYGWQLDGFGAKRKGAMIASLSNGLVTAEVHVCARQGSPKGIGYTSSFDLILMNGAAGASPTPEGLGRVVKTLATLIADAEARHPIRVATLSGVLSHDRRVERYGPEAIA